MPKFSIIMPTYNRADKIARAIQSVLKQQLESWEMIIVDDGSQDDTSDVVTPFLKDSRIQYLSQENRGVSLARNYGVTYAKSPFIVFLDSDDEVHPRWLEEFHELLMSNPEAGYLSCGYVLEGEQFRPREGRAFSDKPYLCAPAGTFALAYEIFIQIGGYDPILRQSENWEMTARALTHCKEHDYTVHHTDNCNIIWHLEKTESQLCERDHDRALAYLRLHQKYADGGLFQHRAPRFLLGAAVNFLRAGNISQSRAYFYKSFWMYPSIKALLRLLCFEIPFLRKKIWVNRKFLIEITPD